MKKEEIYVVIDSEEKELRSIQILSNAGEKIQHGSLCWKKLNKNYNLEFDAYSKEWIQLYHAGTEIKLDQLQQMLTPTHMPLDELKLLAESYGFELVEKKRGIKIGDFGKFECPNKINHAFGFLKSIEGNEKFIEQTKDNCISSWSNFRHLTDEEKQAIQENW